MPNSLLLLILFSTCFFESMWGFQSFSLLPVAGLSLFLLIFRIDHINLPLSDIIIIMFIIIILSLSSIIVIYNYGLSLVNLSPYLSSFIGIFVFTIVVSLFSNINKNDLFKIISFVLIIQIGILFSQLLLWYIFRIDLDIGKILGGPGHRAIGYNQKYRPTGIFDEPGIYAIFVYSLFSTRYLIKQKIDLLGWISIISIIFTNSVFGIILTFLFLFWSYCFKFKAKGKGIAASLIAIMLILIGLSSQRFINIFNGNDYSMLSKATILSKFITDDNYIFLGFGLLSIENWPDFSYQAAGDLTFFISSLIIFGVPLGIPLIICVILLAINQKWNKYTLLVLIPLIKLSIVNWLFFWIYLAIVKIASSSSKEKDNG